MDDKVFVAWAAGFFDGEGCVLVSERDGGAFYQLFISVTQQDPAALHLFKQRWGGNVTPDKTAHVGYERKRGAVLCWRWKCTGAVGVSFLKEIFPYSIVKATQIALALEWPDADIRYCARRRMPNTVREKRRAIMHGLRELRNSTKVYIGGVHA